MDRVASGRSDPTVLHVQGVWSPSPYPARAKPSELIAIHSHCRSPNASSRKWLVNARGDENDEFFASTGIRLISPDARQRCSE